MNRTVKLTENELKVVIEESVKRIVNEIQGTDPQDMVRHAIELLEDYAHSTGHKATMLDLAPVFNCLKNALKLMA